MQIQHLTHRHARGWSHALPVELDGPDTLVLAFGAPEGDDARAALRELQAAFPASVQAGCSSAGEIAGSQVDDGSLSVAVVHFERSRLRRAGGSLHDGSDSADLGRRLAGQLPARLDGVALRAVLLLAPGMDVNGAALVRGLREQLPPGVVVTGGLAGDGSRFERTWVLDDTGPAERAACAVGVYGEAVRVGHGCDGGWVDFGPERQITRSEGPVLYELDGRPALELYKNYLGDLVGQLPGSALLFPLSMRAPEPGAPTLVRTILAVDEARQSMTFAGDMPPGATVRLMRSSVDRLVDSAEEAGLRAVQAVGGVAAPPVLAVSISCIGRRLLMGERTDDEVEAVALRLPPGSVHVGFYSYGEVAPGHDSDGAELHNQTMTVTVLTEA